jgi:hypothetical protein
MQFRIGSDMGRIDMTQHYSNPERESDPHALPDLEVFELTAAEVAERDEDMVFEYMRRHEFRLASMNSRTREQMIDAMIAENGIQGGYFYWYCFPGCMPDSDAIGPYTTHAEAVRAAQDDAAG